MKRGFKIDDNVIFINNNPRYYGSDSTLKGKIGVIRAIDLHACEENGNQSLCIDWKDGRYHWWTFSTDIRLAKPSELS